MLKDKKKFFIERRNNTSCIEVIKCRYHIIDFPYPLENYRVMRVVTEGGIADFSIEVS